MQEAISIQTQKQFDAVWDKYAKDLKVTSPDGDRHLRRHIQDTFLQMGLRNGKFCGDMNGGTDGDKGRKAQTWYKRNGFIELTFERFAHKYLLNDGKFAVRVYAWADIKRVLTNLVPGRIFTSDHIDDFCDRIAKHGACDFTNWSPLANGGFGFNGMLTKGGSYFAQYDYKILGVLEYFAILDAIKSIDEVVVTAKATAPLNVNMNGYRKPSGYILKQVYPTCGFKEGQIVKGETDPYNGARMASWPLFYEPVFQDEKFTVKCDSGDFEVTIKDEVTGDRVGGTVAVYDGLQYNKQMLSAMLPTGFVKKLNDHPIGYDKINIGCKIGVSLFSIKELISLLKQGEEI
jgi:hypothetical protein